MKQYESAYKYMRSISQEKNYNNFMVDRMEFINYLRQMHSVNELEALQSGLKAELDYNKNLVQHFTSLTNSLAIVIISVVVSIFVAFLTIISTTIEISFSANQEINLVEIKYSQEIVEGKNEDTTALKKMRDELVEWLDSSIIPELFSKVTKWVFYFSVSIFSLIYFLALFFLNKIKKLNLYQEIVEKALSSTSTKS